MCKDMFAVRAAAVASTSLAGPKFVQHHLADVEEQVASHGGKQACTVVNNEGAEGRQTAEKQE